MNRIAGSQVFAPLFIALSLTATAAEEAQYTVILAEDHFQLRDYAAQVVAEVIVTGNLEDAGSDAFKPLFGYISGDNGASEEIAMTAPVGQRPAGEKIATTAPVSQQRSGNDWAVSFMMPAGRTIGDLPAPTDPKIGLREVPGRRVATVRYSGVWTEKRFQRYKAELENWMRRRQFVATGDPIWARYDPPFMPWFMRRNEIMIPVARETPQTN